MVESVAISDGQFRTGVVAGGILLAAGITIVRFCGSVSLPPKPPPPSGSVAESGATTNQLLSKSAMTPGMYQEYVVRDARAAGIGTPTIDEMSRKLPYQIDTARHVLELDKITPIAGLEITAIRSGESIVLDIRNKSQLDLAYRVVSDVAACDAAGPLPFNAMVLARGEHETRTECAWRDDLAIAITRVETLALSPLSAWYVNHVPPEAVGIEPRIARGHRGLQTTDKCAPMLGQATRNGIESGEIGWRDLVDFYARHRCQTYTFPLEYRAFTTDGQRPLPVTASDR
jgi:hypothetical protein